MFTPALAKLVEDFNISTSVSQMTVAIYLGGYALGQLPYGWLSSRFGARFAIFTGLIVFVLGSLLCAWSPTFSVLMAGRAVMALGAAVGLVMTFTLVGQFYTVKEARSIFAYTTISLAIAPGLANLIGGLLTGYLGWKCCFYFLIMYAGLVGLSASRVPRFQGQRQSFAVRSYFDAMKNGRFVVLSLMAAMTTAVIYVFASTAPLTAVYFLEVAPQFYGLVSFVPFIGTVSGCLIAAEISKKISVQKAIAIGLSISLCGALVKWTLVKGFGLHVWSLFLPMPLIYLGMPFVYSNGAALCLNMVKDKSVGSAVFCTTNIGLSLFGVMMMSWMGVSSLCLMPIVFLTMIVLMAGLFGLNLILGRKGVASEIPQVDGS